MSRSRGQGAGYLLALLMMSYAFAVVDRQLLSYMVEPIKHTMGIDDLHISLLQGGAFSITYGTLALPLGWLIDRGTRRRILGIGFAVWSLATIAFGLSHSYTELVLARILVGVGEATLHPAAYSLLADCFTGRRRTMAMGVYAVGPPVGGVAAALLSALVGWLAGHGGIGASLLPVDQTWRVAFLVSGLPGLVLALMIGVGRDPPRIELAPALDTPAIRLLPYLAANWRTFTTLYTGFGLLTLFTYAINGWAPVFFERTHGWTAVEVGLAFAAQSAVTGVAGALVAGALPDLLTRRGFSDGVPRVAGLAILVATGPALLAFLSGSGLVGFAWLTVLNFVLNMPFALAPAALQAVTPNRLRGRVAGIFLIVNNVVGISLGPLLVAVLAHRSTDTADLRWPLVTVIAIAAPLAATILLLGLRHFRRTAALTDAGA